MNDTSYRLVFEGLDQTAQLRKLVVYFQKELGLSEEAIRNLLTAPPRVLIQASDHHNVTLMQEAFRKTGCRTVAEPVVVHPSLPFAISREHYKVMNQELSKILRVRANLALFLCQLSSTVAGTILPSMMGPIMEKLEGAFRESDTLLGIDDSHLIILGFSTDREGVKHLENKTKRVLTDLLGDAVRTTTGYALFPQEGRSLSALLDLAEQKRAKNDPRAAPTPAETEKVKKSGPIQEDGKTGAASLQQCFSRAGGRILTRLQNLDPEVLWLGLSRLPESKQREFWARLPFDSPLASTLKEMIDTQRRPVSDTAAGVHFEAVIHQLEHEEEPGGQKEMKERILSKLSRVEALPTLPAVATHIFSIASNPNSSAQDLTKIIANDPPLTSKLLKIVNSAFYGFPQKIGDVKQAIVILGTDEIMDLSFGLAAAKVFDAKPIEGVFDPKTLWRHSMGVALIAQKLCQEMPKCQRLGGFTAGLLHDLGKIFMLEHFSEAYREVHQEAGKNGHHLFELEEKRFGLHHATIGESLAANWNLPEALVRAIAFHHQPFSAPSHGEMAALIGLADYLQHRAVLAEEGLEKTSLALPPLTVGHWQILQEHFRALDNEELATMTEQALVTLNQNEHLFAMLD